MTYQLLDWDTHFFDIRISKILSEDLRLDQLETILEDNRKEGLQLVYWQSSNKISETAAGSLGGSLVDEKATYVVSLDSLTVDNGQEDNLIEKANLTMPMGDFEKLAIQSGVHSRYSVDRKFPTTKFEKLYKLWIHKSIKGDIAKEVLVIREAEHIVAMVTLGEKQGRGDIGLIAVDPQHRGRRFGVKLMRAAQLWCKQQGYSVSQVVTQGTNRPACKLYEKSGYTLEKIKYFYHFWL